MIHPPDVIGKYAPDAVIGMLGAASAAVGGDAAPAPPSADKGDELANLHAWGEYKGANWRQEGIHDNPGIFLINVKSYMYACWYLLIGVLYEVAATIFRNKNFKLDGDRKGLTRSAILIILFMVIHALGNLHVFLGPDDFNGYGYFYVRLYRTGFGLNANIVEEYLLLAAVMHVLVGLKRTADINMGRPLNSGALNMAISGVTLLLFMVVHLFQFRFGATTPYNVRPPPYLINFSELPHLFFTEDKSVPFVAVRDIYKLEMDVFSNIGG